MLVPIVLSVASLLMPAPPVAAPGGTIHAQIDAPILEVAMPAEKSGPVSAIVWAGGMAVRLDCSKCAAAQKELDRLAADFYKPKSWVVRGDAVKASGRLESRPAGDGKPAFTFLVVESLTLIPGE